MIPFKYGTVVSGNDFCGRKDLIKQLTDFITSSQNVLVQGERRIGKTSLILETIRRLKAYRPVLVDFMEVKTTHDVCQRLIKAIFTFESKEGLFSRVLKSLSSLRPQFGIDPVTGSPTLSLDPTARLTPESLEGIFDLMRDLNKRKKVVVVFDEFQDILNLDDCKSTLVIIRSRIQYHGDVPYIFAGSIRRKLDEIFTRHDSPLFKSAILLTVGPLDSKELSAFIKKKFAGGGRTISEPTLDRIFDITGYVTGDVLQLCEALWSTTEEGASIAEGNFSPAFELIFSREVKAYEQILSDLTANQFKCLVALARWGGKAPTSSSFLRDAGFSQPSSVTKALHKLLRMNLLFKVTGEYRFVNPFFRAWLIHKNY